MPKIGDYLRSYVGPLETPAVCRMRVYRLHSGGIAVIVSDEPETPPRASVTNCAELLASEVRQQLLDPGQALVWVEYDPGPPEEFDRVLFHWDGMVYTEPAWKPSTRAQVEALIGEALDF